MNISKCLCGSKNLTIYKKKFTHQTGLYCADCGRWLKWVTEKEIKSYVLRRHYNNYDFVRKS